MARTTTRLRVRGVVGSVRFPAPWASASRALPLPPPPLPLPPPEPLPVRAERRTRDVPPPIEPEPDDDDATILDPEDEPGLILVGAKPACEILIDDEETGLTTPQRDLALSPGLHRVTLRNAEHEIERSYDVVVEAGEQLKLIVDLTDEMQ